MTFGDNVLVGPQCGFYTSGHPLDAAKRAQGLEYAYPIRVGSGVWIGGGVRVMPGVSIGDGAVIASGSGNTFIDDFPAGRVEDPVSCGGSVAEGSPNVFVGG